MVIVVRNGIGNSNSNPKNKNDFGKGMNPSLLPGVQMFFLALVKFGLVWFYGTLTIEDYLIPNPF